MKRLVAFGIAAILFATATAGLHVYAYRVLPVGDRSVNGWISFEKDSSYNLLENNIKDDTVLLLGSSELNHFSWSRYHPRNIFNRDGVNVMCIGSAVTQSLNHASLIAALGNKINSKKVVLIVSPTWFYSHRDTAQRYGMRLSRDFYNHAINNKSLPDAVSKLLRNALDEAYQGDIPKRYIEQEKSIIRAALAWNKLDEDNLNHLRTIKKNKTIEFTKYKPLVDKKVRKKINKQYNVYKHSSIMRPWVFKKSKDKNIGYDFVGSKEYDYLRLFILVCKSQGINPVIVIQPMNGAWYDYTGLKADKRKVCYDNIKAVAGEEEATVVDLSGNEYTPGFFLDAVHPSEKGWLEIDEKIYKYLKTDN